MMPIPPQLPYILGTADLYLTPIYIIILFLLVKKLKKKYYSGSPIQYFMLPAFTIHVIGCIFFALIYQYYYGYGDIYGYFTGAHETWIAFIKNPRIAFELIFTRRENFSQNALDWAPYCSYVWFADSFSAIMRIAGFVGLFCFGTYLPMALIFGLFSFWGTWLIYITVNKWFPHLFKYTAIACLFIPSVIIWSSGVSKEPPCMFGLGLCFYAFDKILKRRKLIRNIIYFIIGAVAMLSLKDYIFYVFAIAAVVWVFRFFLLQIKNYVIRLSVLVLIMLSLISYLIYSINTLQESFMEGLSKGEHLQEMMTSVNDTYGGSGYTLPPVNLNAGGFIQSFLLSLNVALFRPYIWECKNALMLMSFAESFATLVLVLIVVFKVGISKIIVYCNKYPLLLFMLIFTLLFAPLVGFISFNFGTLVRYKIFCLPFFFSFLVILLFDKKLHAENTNKR
jgi:hypothetical protein